MANKSKANLVGVVLKGLAYRDLDVGANGEPLISDYDPGALADQEWVSRKASEQSEQHVLLHHGPSPESGLGVHDDWCFECTKSFLCTIIGADSTEYLVQAAHGMNMVENLSNQESAASLAMIVLRSIDENRDKAMRDATRAVRYREGFAAPEAEGALKSWSADLDRITDFYAEWIGSRFAGMVDRAEQLSTITTRGDVPPNVRRYLVEASKCYILGQYLGSLLVCRSALIFSLEDFLIREGKGRELEALRAGHSYAVAPLVEIARTLKKWKLQPALEYALEVGRAANEAVHSAAPEPERCRDLFIKTRGVLKELYP